MRFQVLKESLKQTLKSYENEFNEKKQEKCCYCHQCLLNSQVFVFNFLYFPNLDLVTMKRFWIVYNPFSWKCMGVRSRAAEKSSLRNLNAVNAFIVRLDKDFKIKHSSCCVNLYAKFWIEKILKACIVECWWC